MACAENNPDVFNEAPIHPTAARPISEPLFVANAAAHLGDDRIIDLRDLVSARRMCGDLLAATRPPVRLPP
jgi:hypothetical protein